MAPGLWPFAHDPDLARSLPCGSRSEKSFPVTTPGTTRDVPKVSRHNRWHADVGMATPDALNVQFLGRMRFLIFDH